MSPETYTHAAWSFESAILWGDHELDDETIINTLEDIQRYFDYSDDPMRSLKIYIARVIIAASKKKRSGMNPRVWLPSPILDGFSSPGKKIKGLKAMLQKEPRFETVLDIFTPYYLQYTQELSAHILQKCSEDLNKQNLGKWVQLFYNATNHQPQV